MAKKIVKVEEKKSGLDLGKITKTIMENGEAIEKIADGIGDLIEGKSSKTKKSTKAKKTKNTDSSSMSKVIDLAGTLLKK